jgi:type IV pilus assembly protein PilA
MAKRAAESGLFCFIEDDGQCPGRKYQSGNGMGARGRGFTLVETIIVVALLALVLAAAVPSYRDYVTRSKLSEAVDSVTPMQLEVGQACLSKYLAGATNASLGLRAASDYATPSAVQSISVTGASATAAKITVTLKAFGGVTAGSTLVYAGTCSAGGVSWQIDASSTLPTKYRPRV